MSVTLAAVLLSSIPTFSAGEPVIFQGNPLDTGMGSAPLVHDWNSDGLNDLIIGTRTTLSPFPVETGPVLFMPNTGTASSPVFDSWTMLEADGEPISYSS